MTAEPTKRKPTTTGRRSRAEKSRHGRDQDRQRATADQQRRQAEALRQANFLAITQAADRLKDTWKERLRGGLPDVASELSSFMQVVRGVARGDGSYSVSDLLVATNTLADRAQTTFALITSPFQTFSDQVTADAIDMVRADRTYQRDDPRVQPIFRGIQKVNEIVHERNHPFSEAISSAAFEQIDTHFKTIIGELEHLEADIGSFDYSRRKYADQPLANPFRQAPSTGSATSPTPGNPWRSKSEASSQAEDFHPAPTTTDAAAATGNPFRSDSDIVVPPPTSSIPAVTSANPFRAAQTSSGASTSPSRPPSATALVSPTPGSPTKDRMVLYRDPATRN